jgi:hypothetical protein
MGRFVDFWNGAAGWDRKLAADHCATPCRRACKVIADFAMLLDAARDAAAFGCNALILPGDRSTAVAERVAEILAARIEMPGCRPLDRTCGARHRPRTDRGRNSAPSSPRWC